MTRFGSGRRRGFALRELAVGVSCLVVAGGLLASLTGATRDLSAAQVCANNMRQLFAGMTAYVNQYNSYPPNAPYPTYMASETINGVSTGGWDPNIGWILTYGLGLEPPARDTATGHFKWYGTSWESVPDVCKCPAMPAAMLDPTNPEVANPARGEGTPFETVLYQYVLSYQTSGTCRAACPVGKTQVSGRNPSVPDPTRPQPYSNCQGGCPYVWVYEHSLSYPANEDSGSAGQEYGCWIQAVHPAEVQQPGKVYYLGDSRDYRPQPSGTPYCWPVAGTYTGWANGWGNKVFLGTRHYGYANMMYLDGRVTRDNQTHDPHWNMVYNPTGGAPQSGQWRIATFATSIQLANIRTQVHLMPVLMVKGWEYFFNASGMKP